MMPIKLFHGMGHAAEFVLSSLAAVGLVLLLILWERCRNRRDHRQ